MGLEDFYTSFKSEVVGANGTRFIFAGMRTNPRSIKSMEDVDIAWIEEAENVSKDSWDLLVPTIRKDGSEIWITFNPNFSSDETYRRWVENPPPYAKVVQMNWRDNPWFNDILRREMMECKRKSHSDYLHTWEGVPKDKAGTTKLKLEWLQPWPAREWTGFNVYLTVDPANSNKYFKIQGN
jgi:phage terminase large subunit